MMNMWKGKGWITKLLLASPDFLRPVLMSEKVEFEGEKSFLMYREFFMDLELILEVPGIPKLTSLKFLDLIGISLFKVELVGIHFIL